MVTYKSLQTSLKLHRSNGIEIQCRLNAKREILEAELARIEALLSTTESTPDMWEMEVEEADEPVTQITPPIYQLCLPPATEIEPSTTAISSTVSFAPLLYLLAIFAFSLAAFFELSIRLVRFTVQVAYPYCTDKLTTYFNYLPPHTPFNRLI